MWIPATKLEQWRRRYSFTRPNFLQQPPLKWLQAQVKVQWVAAAVRSDSNRVCAPKCWLPLLRHCRYNCTCLTHGTQYVDIMAFCPIPVIPLYLIYVSILHKHLIGNLHTNNKYINYVLYRNTFTFNYPDTSWKLAVCATMFCIYPTTRLDLDFPFCNGTPTHYLHWFHMKSMDKSSSCLMGIELTEMNTSHELSIIRIIDAESSKIQHHAWYLWSVAIGSWDICKINSLTAMQAMQLDGLKPMSWLEYDGTFKIVAHCMKMVPTTGSNFIKNKQLNRLAGGW